MTNAQLVPAVLAPLLIWRFYRRFRGSVGRQSFRPTRTIVSLIFMALVLCLVGASVMHVGATLWPLFAGLAAGFVVGIVGYKLTAFEATADGRFYTPNAYLGAAVSLLLVGRLVYRFALLYSTPGMAQGAPPSLGQSPLTLFVLGLTFGYYIAYRALLLFRLRIAAPAVSTA